MVAVSRRTFLASAGTAVVAGALADDEKIVDGGYADVSWPGDPVRATPVLPPGAENAERFSRLCVGCQLCVTKCPNHVLRSCGSAKSASPLGRLQPEMRFTRGYCRPECTTCGEVCPAGAIRRLSPKEKQAVHVGHAVWHKDLCLAASEGVTCHACERHCPVNAITLAPGDPNDKNSPKVPVVDAEKCIGCGACEHLCPSRPFPAMTVEGNPT